MKLIRIFILIFVCISIILIDLPENYSVSFSVGGQKIDFMIRPPSVNMTIGSMQIKKEFSTKLGLDLKGGSHLVFDIDTKKVKKEDIGDALNSARDIIEKRVNFYGVSEPVVQTTKSGDRYRLNVDLPGIDNVSEAVRLIGQTAQLTFKEEASREAKTASSPAGLENLTKDTGITGKHIKKATVTFDSQSGNPEVALNFTKEGADLFALVTKRNVGRPVAIFLDNFILSAPIVQQEIPDGNAVINGKFTVDDAKKLAIAINSGALPLPIKLVEQKNIGPTLGEMEVRKSVYAGFIGLLMVLVFMVVYYGRFGVIASMALIIYGLISLAIFRIIPVVLTLPGIAGFILSIGMAVDSNILIFERIKEEMRKGKTPEIAIKLGFGRAIDAIKDANITTLTVAFILFNPLSWEFLPQFGMVRGFALTLAIGVATSLFTGVFITRRLIDLFYKT